MYFSAKAAPRLTAHITKAQQSGLPKLLSRATKTTTKNNRRVACQSSFVKKYAKKGESCDEYPFASTNQGAVAAGNNARRVPSNCRYPAAIKSGAKGYSICRIPASQNSYQGGKLSSMYKRDRVLVGDRYYARVTK